jgi:hypothetical protein
MTKPIKLEDAYRFPGYVPQANVRGIFGDSSARVLTLRRKEKKRHAAPVDLSTRDFTTGKLGAYETYPVVGFASTWNWRFAEFLAGGVAW